MCLCMCCLCVCKIDNHKYMYITNKALKTYNLKDHKFYVTISVIFFRSIGIQIKIKIVLKV